MKKSFIMNSRFLLVTLISVTVFGFSANAQNEKKVTPVLEIGAGLSLEQNSYSGRWIPGLATEFNFGLEIRLDNKWSVMPQIGHNLMYGEVLHAVLGYVGCDFDVYSFYNAAVLGRYRIKDGMAVGFGPAIYITGNNDTYYIDADPSDPLNGRTKIKPLDLCVRTTLTWDLGEHWRIGALANIGLRNMMLQYPDIGVTGHTHLFSLCFIAGYRF